MVFETSTPLAIEVARNIHAEYEAATALAFVIYNAMCNSGIPPGVVDPVFIACALAYFMKVRHLLDLNL